MSKVSERTACRLAIAAAEIALQPVPNDADVVYMPSVFIQAMLPHSDPGNIPVWRKKNGDCLLSVRPYIDASGSCRYPYGARVRLLLCWLTTEAVRTGARRIEIGKSVAQFVRKVGGDPSTGGGVRSDRECIRLQLTYLLRATIDYEFNGRTEMAWKTLPVGETGNLGWGGKAEAEENGVAGRVLLSEGFFELVQGHAVPLDFRALKVLRHSPMAIDVYAWTTYRVASLNRNNTHGAFVPWRALDKQFGANYGEVSQFAKAFKRALRYVQQVYPALKCSLKPGGIHVFVGPTAVPIRPKRLRG